MTLTRSLFPISQPVGAPWGALRHQNVYSVFVLVLLSACARSRQRTGQIGHVQRWEVLDNDSQHVKSISISAHLRENQSPADDLQRQLPRVAQVQAHHRIALEQKRSAQGRDPRAIATLNARVHPSRARVCARAGASRVPADARRPGQTISSLVIEGIGSRFITPLSGAGAQRRQSWYQAMMMEEARHGDGDKGRVVTQVIP